MVFAVSRVLRAVEHAPEFRLGVDRLADKWVHTGSFAPGRKICTLIAAMVAGATHIDHVDVLRAGCRFG